jgi:hypothetical protein
VATANDLITRALRRARVLGMDQVPSAEVAADALAELNSMLDEWWNDSLAVFHVLQENFALVAGQPSRTIGPAANFVTTRPLELLDGCFVRRAGIDYPLTVLRDRTLYDNIAEQDGASGIPEYVFYDAAMPPGRCTSGRCRIRPTRSTSIPRRGCRARGARHRDLAPARL